MRSGRRDTAAAPCSGHGGRGPLLCTTEEVFTSLPRIPSCRTVPGRPDRTAPSGHSFALNGTAPTVRLNRAALSRMETQLHRTAFVHVFRHSAHPVVPPLAHKTHLR